MKKTYVTTMPDHIGAFLKASKCFASLGVNITRVSYNKAVDSNTLFIDAEGTEEQLKKADEKLTEIGYLNSNKSDTSILLIECKLKDVPGAVTDILTLIGEFNFNISYISSQENGSDYQYFKMGLYIDNAEKISHFLAEAEKLCEVRIIDYNSAEKIYDNSIFYNSFVKELSKNIDLTEETKNKLLVNTNLAMQTLDETGLSPYRTFDSIGKFSELLASCKGENFEPRISRHNITENTEVILIEPPCGSNTAIIKSMGEILFIDSGYALYKDEMLPIIKGLVPEFDSIKKRILVTHADVDHCGLLNLFDEVIVSHKSALSLTREYMNEDGFREENSLHKPYINICKILTAYEPVEKSKLVPMWNNVENQKTPLVQIGFFSVGELNFEVYEGFGGHLQGEIVLIDYEHNISFTGDVYINMKGLTREQAEYNQYAPILMTSVDTDPQKCAMERKAVLQRLGGGKWQIFGAHGYKKDYSVNVE